MSQHPGHPSNEATLLGGGGNLNAPNSVISVAAGTSGNLIQGTIDRANFGQQTKHTEVNTIEHTTIAHVHHHYGGAGKSKEYPSTSRSARARPKQTARKESTSLSTGARPKRTVKEETSTSGVRASKRRKFKSSNADEGGTIEKKKDFLSSIDKENLSDEEQEEFSTSDSSEASEDVPEDCVHLSDSIWMFPDRRISTHGEIYEGELRSRIHDARPIVLKLVANIPQSITEARILAKLNYHSHVLSLIQSDIFNCGFYDQIYIALDKCHHENLREFITNRKKQGFAFNLSRAIEIAKQMVDGVKYIHEKRIIHKDLKPDNILFSLDQRLIKIADFGVSQEIDSTSAEVFEKGQFGTNGFRPPESFGRGVISQKSDIFSLGVTLYFVLSNGEHLFGEDPDGWNHHMINGIIDLSGSLVLNIKTTEHLIKSMIKQKINHRPTIWQVSKHSFWTGNEVSCDFDYHCPESPISLIPPTSEKPSYNVDHLYEILEFSEKICLRDEAAAAKTRQRIKDNHEDQASSERKPDLAAEGTNVQVKLGTQEANGTIEKKKDFLSSIDEENVSAEEQEEFSTSDSSEASEDVPEGCVQLSDSIWMFPDRRISTHGEIYEGELRSEICDAVPIVLKLVVNTPQSTTEARILAKLNNHSHVLSLIHTGTIKFGFVNQFYIALDKCHHENLREFVTNRKNQGLAFNLSRAIEITKQMVDGVKYIHENRIIHKDITPDNILFSLDQRLIKIADFGGSQEIDSTSTEVLEEGQFGTNGFRPPESFGRGIISQKSDIFSLGVTFYFVLSNGEHPFDKDQASWNYHMQNGKIDLSGLLVPNIKTTEHLIKSMIKHKINDRPTIWQVSEHPFWTGNEVSCDFDYHCPASSAYLLSPTSEEPNHNIADLYELLEHMTKVKLRDEAEAAKIQSKGPRWSQDECDAPIAGLGPQVDNRVARVEAPDDDPE